MGGEKREKMDEVDRGRACLLDGAAHNYYQASIRPAKTSLLQQRLSSINIFTVFIIGSLSTYSAQWSVFFDQTIQAKY